MGRARRAPSSHSQREARGCSGPCRGPCTPAGRGRLALDRLAARPRTRQRARRLGPDASARVPAPEAAVGKAGGGPAWGRGSARIRALLFSRRRRRRCRERADSRGRADVGRSQRPTCVDTVPAALCSDPRAPRRPSIQTRGSVSLAEAGESSRRSVSVCLRRMEPPGSMRSASVPSQHLAMKRADRCISSR